MESARLEEAIRRREELKMKLKNYISRLEEEFEERPRGYSESARYRTQLRQPEYSVEARSSSNPQFYRNISPQFQETSLRHLRNYYPSRPVVLPPITGLPTSAATNKKPDVMEMMMLQNAQSHQLMMHQMMMSMVKPRPTSSRRSSPDGSRISDLKMLKHFLKDRERPPPVHYHHPYQPETQGIVSQYALPPAQFQPAIRYIEVEPLRPPRIIHQPKEPDPEMIPNPKPIPNNTKKNYGTLPFPGPLPLRRFRRAGYAILFYFYIKSKFLNPWQRSLKAVIKENSRMIDIRLKDAIECLHGYYLNPAKKTFQILQQITSSGATDFSVVATNSSKGASKVYEELAAIVENIVFEMTEIMPTTGVLGTHKKSTVYRIIQRNQVFPDNYFWQLEKELLRVNSKNSISSFVMEPEGVILLIGLFVSRAFVTSILFKPVEAGLIAANYQAPDRQLFENNLKLLATIFVFIIRTMYSYSSGTAAKKPPAPMPAELASRLYTDEEMSKVYKKIAKSFEYAEKLLSGWGKEYYTKLDRVV